MSQWTHVVGTVYYTADSKGDAGIMEMFKTCDPWSLNKKVQRGEMTEEEYKKRLDEVSVPMGSEGSLYMHMSRDHLDKDNICPEFRSFSFYGDLRDYGGDRKIEELISWWKNFHRKLWIHQSTLQIRDDWTKEIILVNCWGNYDMKHEDETDGSDHEYKFSEICVPICGHKKNPWIRKPFNQEV